jgi:protein phosphatase
MNTFLKNILIRSPNSEKRGDNIVVSGMTDVGLVRDHNEDSYIVLHDDSRLGSGDTVMAVADGMGGHAAGEIASSITISDIKSRFYTEEHHNLDTREFLGFLGRTLETANRSVFEAGQNNSRRGMGTTCILVVLRGSRLHYAHVGDSRAYLVRRGRIRQITIDHSWVQESVDAGIFTAEEARTHPNRNVITRAIGLDPEVKVDLGSQELKNGDLVILCSDGLNSMVSDTVIQNMALSCRDDDVCQALVTAAKEAGGDDNITVITAKFDRAKSLNEEDVDISYRDTVDMRPTTSIINKFRGLFRNAD